MSRFFVARANASVVAIALLNGFSHNQSLANSGTASVRLESKAIQLLPASPLFIAGTGNVYTYFSTFNGSSGLFLMDRPAGYVSGELRPRTGAPGIYESAYFQSTEVVQLDYGSFAVSLSTTDTRGFGLPDAFQYDLAGTFTATGSGFSPVTNQSFSIFVAFTRAAGSGIGTYAATTQGTGTPAFTFRGTYNLAAYIGTLSYTRDSGGNSLRVTLASVADPARTITGQTNFTVQNADSVVYSAFTGRDPNGVLYRVNFGTLARTGKTYRADLKLVDGLPQTSWADFTDYRFTVEDLTDSNGDGIPDFSDPIAGRPAIVTAPPTALTVNAGQDVTLVAVASGGLRYQWYVGGRAIPNGTSPTLVLHNVTSADAGDYSLFISNDVGNAATTRTTLTVNSPPVIIGQPQSISQLNAGQNVSFTVTADNIGVSPGTLSYQWKFNGMPIPTEIGKTYGVNNVQYRNEGFYSVTVTNRYGSTDSDAALVTIRDGRLSRISNLSVRTNLDSGQILTVGFVTTGAKPLLLRGLGPGLHDVFPQFFKVADVFADPLLELYNASGVWIDVNDNWNSGLATVMASVGAFPLTPGSNDAAQTVNASGQYTAQLKGSGRGVVLLEVYDTTATFLPRLANVSARNQVGTGANILIVGFVIAGPGPRTVLIRGIGPALRDVFGVSGALADSRLEIFRPDGSRITSNDNWSSSLAATFDRVGAFRLPNGSKDAALLITLPPGGYTAQVSGVGGTTGDGLVEVYEVP